jgi:hypothetical protein
MVGQSHTYAPYLTVFLVISLPLTPYKYGFGQPSMMMCHARLMMCHACLMMCHACHAPEASSDCSFYL